MFKIIAVDDEEISLNRLKRIFREESRIDSVNTFSRPHDAIDYVKTNPVDIAFLDIEMPGMTGLALAKELLNIRPSIEIIFLTAYDQYALDAFSVHATGYLLKPVEIESLSEQLDIIIGRKFPAQDEPRKLFVQTFGPFSCRVASTGELIKFRTAKAEELFALLIDGKNCTRSKDFILETLWPNLDDIDKVGNNFRVTCSYLRNALSAAGFENIFIREKEDYYLDLKQIDSDLFKFREIANTYQAMPLEEIAKIAPLYKGVYLENRFYDWAESPRQWFKNQSMKIMDYCLNKYIEKSDYDTADKITHDMIVCDPYDEHAVGEAIKLKLHFRNFTLARELYNNFAKKLKEDLDEEPSEYILSLIKDI